MLCRQMGATKSSLAGAVVCRFGAFEADLVRAELRKFGLRIRLERKPWQLLVHFLNHPRETVTRQELHRLLWSENVFVDFETGLNVAVKKLRTALSDSVEKPTYIETVVGEGYRWIAPTETLGREYCREDYANFLPPVVPHPSSELAPKNLPESSQTSLSLPSLAAAEGTLGLAAATAPHPSFWKRRSSFVTFALLGIVLAILIGVRTIGPRFRPSEVLHSDKKIMLVVLPFDNLSGDSGQEYLSDGMTEELSEQLGNQDPRQLGVIGRTSAMTYKYSHRTVREIGKELGVDYVLEGSVRSSGGEVRVTAQLVQVSDEAHVWAANYDKNLRNLLQLESDLAEEIARQVGVSIAISQAKKPVHQHVPSPEAHEAYMLGRYQWYKRTGKGWENAEKYFRLAIQRDPEYAAAYAALAECRIRKEEAQAAALKAITLDPTSGEAYTALAWVQLYRYLDPAAARPAFERAIDLAPNYAQAHYSYSQYLETSSHPDQAVSEVKQAVALDPLSQIFNSGLGSVLAEAGRLDEAVKQFKVVLTMNPRFAVAHGGLGRAYLQQAKYTEAIEEFQTEEKLDGNLELGMTGYAYSRSGNKKQALKILSQLHALQRKSQDVSFDLAMVELGLGNKESAISWLQELDEEHEDDGLLFLSSDPVFDPLRSDPRFQDIVRKMTFPSYRATQVLPRPE